MLWCWTIKHDQKGFMHDCLPICLTKLNEKECLNLSPSEQKYSLHPDKPTQLTFHIVTHICTYSFFPLCLTN